MIERRNFSNREDLLCMIAELLPSEGSFAEEKQRRRAETILEALEYRIKDIIDEKLSQYVLKFREDW